MLVINVTSYVGDAPVQKRAPVLQSAPAQKSVPVQGSARAQKRAQVQRGKHENKNDIVVNI